jgi:triosephosphate isomerase
MKNWVLGNWKMNQNLADISAFFGSLEDFSISNEVVAGIAPQAVHLSHCQAAASGRFKIGAQNCHFENSGAYTGESSVLAIKELGCEFILVGHSERRALFAETHEMLAKKTAKVLSEDLLAVFCVGETLGEREAGNTWSVIEEQLNKGLQLVESNVTKLVVAYEPVWAIGTGKTATAEQAGEVHSQIRVWLQARFKDLGEAIPILYGGSVNPGNFASLLENRDICGGLVGGASLKADSFRQLCEIAGKK